MGQSETEGRGQFEKVLVGTAETGGNGSSDITCDDIPNIRILFAQRVEFIVPEDKKDAVHSLPSSS